MSIFVLDCSIAVSWCFEDEASKETDKILNLVLEHGAFVPNLWHLEITNVLIQASKRNRIARNDVPKRLIELSILPIKTDLETHRMAFQEIYTLAQRENLTSYDAAYLELALRRELPIATNDKKLSKVAKKLSVGIL